jgi:hypothetical protein
VNPGDNLWTAPRESDSLFGDSTQPPGQGGITGAAMHAPITAAVAEKHRTITLTNRAPIRIVENDWPVIAQGVCGDEPNEAPWGWEISIRVRRENKKYSPRYIIHAKFSTRDETRDYDDAVNQLVRVGRVLDWQEGANRLWKHISEVGDELRARIINDHLRKRVVCAVDACFAKLPAQEG